jgi:hypothetical protein
MRAVLRLLLEACIVESMHLEAAIVSSISLYYFY